MLHFFFLSLSFLQDSLFFNAQRGVTGCYDIRPAALATSSVRSHCCEKKNKGKKEKRRLRKEKIDDCRSTSSASRRDTLTHSRTNAVFDCCPKTQQILCFFLITVCVSLYNCKYLCVWKVATAQNTLCFSAMMTSVTSAKSD